VIARKEVNMFQLLYDQILIDGCEDAPSMCKGMKFFTSVDGAKDYVSKQAGNMPVEWQLLGKIEISQEVGGIVYSIVETPSISKECL
jgi:hypothetical protein